MCLNRLEPAAIGQMLERALGDAERGLGGRWPLDRDVARERLAQAADGDARRALIWLELAAELAEAQGYHGWKRRWMR
jgi:putative ATPase